MSHHQQLHNKKNYYNVLATHVCNKIFVHVHIYCQHALLWKYGSQLFC
jgi:hypothetical protein